MESLHAATSFSVNAPGHVSVGDKFSVTYRLRDGEGTSLKVPQINGCRLLYGPSTSTSQSYSVVNGQMSSSSSVDYTYYYLAEKEGTYTINEATIMVDGKKYTTNQVKLIIGPASESRSNNRQGQNGSHRSQVEFDDVTTQTSDKAVSANDVFIRIILSKSSAYEQEAVECSIKLYTKYQISEFFCTKQPSFEGFLIEDLEFQSALNNQEEYNGQRYMTALLKKCILFPQKSGKLTITSGNYDLKVMQYDMINMGFFSVPDARERKIKVNSNSVSINISPLPSPQPEVFNGAVGKFTIDSKLIGNTFRTQEPSTLLYTISGTGNIKYLKEPIIDFPSEFEQYTPNIDIDAKISGNNVTGKMIVEYTFVPQEVGNFHIGGDKFVYFDIDSHSYVTLDTPGYDIKVNQGINAPASQRSEVKIKNTDILHIHANSISGKKDSLIVFSWWYWLIYVASASALITVLFIYRRKICLAADVTGMKLAKANKVARKRLRVVNKYMTQNNSEKFYEELLRAIWGYLSDKLSIPASQLSRDNINAELSKYGANQELTDNVITIIDECEMARYAPQSSSSELHSVYDKASAIINNLENLKKK
ncbi:MAG: BatD family protein [Paramuribaculum sp.]|nr:BatD family protein [Paramuribaculum sp.]